MTKTTIALDPARLPALIAARDAIAPLYKTLDESSATLARMRTDETVLKQDIAALEESTAYTDAEGSLSLKTKRAQLELLQRHAAKLESDIPVKTAQLAVHLETLNGLIPHATLPECEKVKARIAKSIKHVFVSSPDQMEAAVKLAPELTSFINFFQRRWYNDGASVTLCASQALPVLEALIEQSNPWSFAGE